MTRIRIDDLPVAENLTPEQEELIQGAGLKPFRPSLESLEGREVPALITPSAPHIDFDMGTVKITANGYMGNSQATVNYVPNSNQTRLQFSYNLESATIDAALVQRIVFEGKESVVDTFTNHTMIPSQFNGMETRDIYRTNETFKMTGPATLDDSAASGQTAIDGRPVGSNTPPPLSWNAPPVNTAKLRLTMRDIDADGFLHMAINDIPSLARNLTEALQYGKLGLNGRRSLDGKSVGRYEYYGPNPGQDAEGQSETHRYVFTLTALDAQGNVLARIQFQSTFGYAQGRMTDTGVNN